MNEKPLHILIIASWYKSDLEPTSGSFIEEQARMLQKRGHKVSVIHPYLKGTFLSTLKNRHTENSQQMDNGILTIRIGVSPVLPKFRKLSYLKLINETEKLMSIYISENGLPNLIHSHSLFMGGGVGLYLSKKFNIPQFHTEHTSGLIFQPKQYTKSDIQFLKNVYQHCKTVFFVSDFALKSISTSLNLPSGNFETLHNLVNNQFFEASNSQTDTPVKFLMIGNFIPVKNHDLLLKAWKIFLNVYPDSTLTIIGNGKGINRLQNLANHLEINNSIIWCKRQNRIIVKRLIDEHDVILSTSKLETFGLSVAEAISSGKPVVTTNSGGINDIVNLNNGIITDHTPNSFALGLMTIKKEYHKYNSIQIQEHAKLIFAEDVIYSRLLYFYSKTMTTWKK
jgi:glycosyltransferase involved in cell wall biosynthesis